MILRGFPWGGPVDLGCSEYADVAECASDVRSYAISRTKRHDPGISANTVAQNGR